MLGLGPDASMSTLIRTWRISGSFIGAHGDRTAGTQRNEPASDGSPAVIDKLNGGRQSPCMGGFIIGVLVGIVVVILVLVQCTRAIF